MMCFLDEMMCFLGIWTQYTSHQWIHRVYLGINLRSGLRVVCMVGSHMRDPSFSEASPWHGAWEYRTNAINGEGFFCVDMTCRGDKHFLFFVRDCYVVLLRPLPLSLCNDPDCWPGSAEVHGHRGRLDYIVDYDPWDPDSDDDPEWSKYRDDASGREWWHRRTDAWCFYHGDPAWKRCWDPACSRVYLQHESGVWFYEDSGCKY